MADPEMSDRSGDTVAVLRGAGVAIDARRAARGLAVFGLLGLAATAAFLFASAFHSNAQLTLLHDEGVPVTATVVTCERHLGGSGSNPVGSTCRGTYRIGGTSYTETLPGDASHAPGSPVQIVVVPGDPALVGSVPGAAAARASAAAYVLPSVLAVLFVALSVAFALAVRRTERRA